MTDAPHDKEKKKGKPGQNLACFILLIRLMMAIFAIGILGYCLWLTIVAWPYFFRPSSFSQDEVTKTCELLSLPADSAFCSASGKPIVEALDVLKRDLERVYPPGSTTIEDLKKHILLNSHGTDYEFVSLPLPWVELEIDPDKEGRVIGYTFIDEEGNTYRLPN